MSQQKTQIINTINNLSLNRLIMLNNEIVGHGEGYIYNVSELEDELDYRYKSTLDKVQYAVEWTNDVYCREYWTWTVYGYVRMLSDKEAREMAIEEIENHIRILTTYDLIRYYNEATNYDQIDIDNVEITKELENFLDEEISDYIEKAFTINIDEIMFLADWIKTGEI